MKNVVRNAALTAFAILPIAQPAPAQQPPDVVTSDMAGNTAMGGGALSGSGGENSPDNTAAGVDALHVNSQGQRNAAFGNYTLAHNVSGADNIAIGWSALSGNSSGDYNVAVGPNALTMNGSGVGNTAVGFAAAAGGGANSGKYNTAIGYQALVLTTTSQGNTVVGALALSANGTGSFNTAVGGSTLLRNTAGASNAAFGRNALYSNTGSYNLGIGLNAGYKLTTGSYNIDLSNEGVAGESGVIRIGAPGTQTAAFIAGISTTHLTGAAVYVGSNGQLGVLASSERYKTAIASMTPNTEKIARLRPVTFHLKNEPRGALQYGLIAEEVEKVYPDLVIRDEKGRIQGVRYDELAPILLSEVQRLQRDQQDIQRQFAELKRRNDAMMAALVAREINARLVSR